MGAHARRPLRREQAASSVRLVLCTLCYLLMLSVTHTEAFVATSGNGKDHAAAEITISTQDFSFSRGVAPDVVIAIEATEIKGSEIRRTQAAAATTSKPTNSKSSASRTTTKTATVGSTRKPPSPATPLTKTTTTKATPYVAQSPLLPQWALPLEYEMSEKLTQQELLMILVVVVSSLSVLGIGTTALWHLVRMIWLYVHEQRLLRLLFARARPAQELKMAMDKHATKMPLAMRPLAQAHVRLVEFQESVDALLAQTASVTFNDTTLVLHGLPPLHAAANSGEGKPTTTSRKTFFHLLSGIESLQCHAEWIAMELSTLSVPVRWTHAIDLTKSMESLKSRMHKLRDRHTGIHAVQQQVVDALEKHHVDGDAINHHQLLQLVASLRQAANASSTTETSTPTSSPLKLPRSPKENKDEFAFFLKSFDELNQQKHVQKALEKAFSTVNVVAAGAMETQTQTQTQTRIASPTSHPSTNQAHNGNSATATNDTKPPVMTTTTSTLTTTMATTTTRVDGGAWTRNLEDWIDRADEMEMTHLDEVKRAQYLLEEAKRESFCLLNSSRDAMQSVESLKTSLVALGADPQAAVLTAAEIYSSRSNMLMLTTTLRSVFDEFRKGDMIKMEDRRRRHEQKEKFKRERIIAKFRGKQILMVEKMEMQRELEQEIQERERLKRHHKAHEEFVTQTKRDRKQFVWMVTKVDVLIVLVVMAIVFFENLTLQIDLLKPECVTSGSSAGGAADASSSAGGSSSMFGSMASSLLTSSWWPSNSLSLIQCRVEYTLRVTGLFLASVASFYVVAQLNLLTTALPLAIACGLYYVRTEWMNMLFRLPVLLVLYGFNSIVLYLLNRSLASADTTRRKATRRALLLYVVFPIVSVLLSVVVSITIACDNPRECVATAIDVTHTTFATLWRLGKQAYRL